MVSCDVACHLTSVVPCNGMECYELKTTLFSLNARNLSKPKVVQSFDDP